MHLTRESDYAIRIVACLANSQQIIGAKTIAEHTDVTIRFSLKILHALVAAKIVKSFKGSNGGYKLAYDPADVSLYDVIFAIEGEYNISRCLDRAFPCERNAESKCKVHNIFDEISVYVRQQLLSVNFEALTKQKTDD